MQVSFPEACPAVHHVCVREADFERLFREHVQPLYGFLAYRCGDGALAEDLLGDVFERVVRSGRRFDPRKGSERAWIYTIALNCLRDHMRRNASETRALTLIAAGATADHGGLRGVEDRDQLLRGMDALRVEEREVVALRFGADLRLEEIAKVLGCPVSTARGRLYAGLRKLREEIDR